MKFYYRASQDPIHLRLLEDQVFKFELDCSQWAEDNGTVTSATATVKTGSVSAGTPTVASNVITMSLTQTTSGVSRVELSFTDGTYTGIQNLFIRYIDRNSILNDGYEL